MEPLDHLLAYGEHCAKESMRISGKLQPTFIIFTKEGSLLLLPADMDNEKEKDSAAMVARLVCLAHGASAVVFVGEAWLSTSDKFCQPSEDPNRKEIVILVGESRTTRKHKILSVIRSESGSFLQKSKEMSCDGVGGRFSNILSREVPSPDVEAKAKDLLASMGITQSLGVIR